MKHEHTKALFDYWDRVRGDRRAPRRLEIEPLAIASILPNVFILERLEENTWRVRLAGTQICAYCGQELRNRLFTSLWPEQERGNVEQALMTVTENGSGILAGLEGCEPHGRIASFELLLLPLATAQGALDRIIGSLVPTDQPFWLGAWPVVTWRLKSTRVLWPDGAPAALFDDEPLPFPGRRTSTERRFAIIEGGLSGKTE